ncbi:hypothetical protein [Pseudomonas syringae]|uniref:hypothetical protein n=1 Tax=Pseudomonas syringae TaxID=317 RepID=UPI000311A021|nr:hypothetical protein [Pseudomonas syringae]
MALTIDEQIAQLQAIRDERGGDVLVIGVADSPTAEYRLGAEGREEVFAIRCHAE